MRNITVYLYDVEQMHDSTYENTVLELNTQERMQEDHFRTFWLEVTPADLKMYDSYRSTHQYCKVFFGGLKIYAGLVLTTDELMCIIKHATRIDEQI